MDLQPPSVLAQLPRPLHASTGKTRIGEVFRLADAKKRKRYEVAVAVDGEAVNIYNIQTPKLVTSYAVPPKSSFSCQPCSVRRKVPTKSTVRRQTYVAVNPQREIKSFVEEHGGNGSSAPVISSSAFSVKDSDSPTIFVGILPTGVDEEEDPFDILTVHEDGRVRRLTAGLETQRWNLHHSELAKFSSSQEIRSCFLVDFEEARKSLFKKRQDLAALAQADTAESGADHTSVLLLVSQPRGSERFDLDEVKVHLFSIPGNVPSGGLNLDESQKMRHLLTTSLPAIEGHSQFGGDGIQWDLHAGSAGLNLAFERGFINFDLSQYKPTVTSRFILDNEEFSSVMRISPQSVIGASKSIVAVFDTQYNSVQRSIPVADIPASTDTRKAPIIFIGYFAKLGLAVATRGNTLVAFDMSSSRNPLGSSLKRSRDGLLIDAIGRGIGASSSPWDPSKKPRTDFTTLGLTKEQSDQWDIMAHTLRESSQAKDPAAFDRAVQDFFGCPLPPRTQYINPELTLFLLSFIFTLREDVPSGARPADRFAGTPTGQLTVSFWPDATCQWLIDLGHFSPNNAEIAVRRSIKPRILPALPTDAFTQALILSDPTYQRLTAVLQGPVLLSPDELTSALKTFINAARTHAYDDYNDDSASSLSLSLPGAAASVQTIFLGINTALQKLHAYPAGARTTSIRAILGRNEIIGLIHHLRLSLATGGYTSRFTETPPAPPSPFQTTPPLSLDVIADCLTSAVDAIGPSGWIAAVAPVSTPADGLHIPSQEAELVADLQAEVSAALSGAEEATYMCGVLREYLGYAASVQRQQSLAGGRKAPAVEERDDAAGIVRCEKLNGADLLVFGSGEADGDDGDGDATGKMLPLSLKAPSSDVSKTKMKKSTGEVQSRSSREIGYLRRKAAGKYSFERLVV
ncbi:hypothetical protein BDV59DRAFT_202757 [Aspergillus ambiguus]|uniref:uncharacterized protein n=1 Tax=Aspergillus ambiguus TaxID=176160 RepID=UPI003CCCFD79